MRHLTGRAVRIALGSAAAVATLALPLALASLHTTTTADTTPSVQAAQEPPAAFDPGEEDLPVPKKPKPTGPGDDTGSWVWDNKEP